MVAFMKDFTGETYAVLRIMVGINFLLHGSQKLFGFPLPAPPEAPPFVIYGAGGIELLGGLLVAIGLQTRWAAFICSGTMAAAYWMAHGLNHLFPMANHGELALLYCFVFLYISARGAGKWSIDGA
jgi:putative oxidoreductase